MSDTDDTYEAMSRDELLAELRARDAHQRAALEAVTEDLRVHEEEIRVQQDELRAQAEALTERTRELEEALGRYTDLYDSAPLGYVTLDEDGTVEEINLTGAQLLGTKRRFVLGTPFVHYLMPVDRNPLLHHLRHAGRARPIP